MIIRTKNICKVLVIITAVMLFCLVSLTMALEPVTHNAINKNIAQGIFLDDYLKKQLGMSNGKDTFFNNKKVIDWISDGGVYEDKPSWCASYWRSRNHFLNPIDNSGFSGWWDTGIFSGMSAINWINQPVFSQSCGYYSWQDARYYFYRALWSDSKTDSDKYFAETSRAMGQLMHLVQDMSVPEHTRNDGHYFFYDYEVWVKGLKISNYSAISFTSSESFPLSINNLFDTNKYDGTNPDITVLSNNIGLAEYSNANFLSPDKIFKGINYPDYGSMMLKIEPDPTTGKSILYLKKVGNGENIDYLARANNFYNYLPADYKKLALTLDDPKVYGNYAAKLIPRAIGYSSQVLSYFFRGEIEAKLLPVFDATKLTSVRIKVRNITPTKETMGGADSVFLLAYRYSPPGAPPDGSGDIYGKVPYSYLLSNELLYGKDGSGNDLEGEAYEPEIRFSTFPLEIPIAEYPNVKFMLIYRGNLGEEKANIAMAESGGIIGKLGVAKPITFHEEWNTAPKGDYNWFQMDSTIFGSNLCPWHNIEHGLSQNDIIGGKLIKTNIRYPIIPAPGETLNPWDGAHFNLSLIGVHNLSGDTYANNVFPIPITKNTYIEFKIDEMTITPNSSPGGTYTHNQGMVLRFNNGYNLQFSLGDQFWYEDKAGYFTFTAGSVIFGNIHDLFKRKNFPIPNDLKLISIGLSQQIGFDVPRDTQFEQRMVVDFIRVVEMEKMKPEQ